MACAFVLAFSYRMRAVAIGLVGFDQRQILQSELYFLLGPPWTLKVEPILNLTNHPYSSNGLSREQIVEGVKYFPLVSTARPVMSLTPQVLSPTSSADAPSFSPLL